MRPTASTMLQQNNNNNYPCLSVSGSARELHQRCSRASLPFPSRLELGLGDLPLIRGLRAWALCSKSRHKAGGLLGGGQAPTAPPPGRGGPTSCPRPADVHLSREWGRPGYGLPLGLDARQAGIGALVTVATLKSSLGGGKTQTQCLFLRTEKGSCLYSTARPGSGVAPGAASRMVGEWLRGKKSGEGGRDAPAGRRDGGPALSVQTAGNRVRVRSGRRWRKSGNAAREERQQRSWEDPAGELAVEERQEEQDKAGPDRKRVPGPQRDGSGNKCCHSLSPKTCSQCGIRPRGKESQDECDGGEVLENGLDGEVKAMERERQKNEEEAEEEGDLPGPSPDQESPNKDSHAGREVDAAESDEGLRSSPGQDQDANPDDMKTRRGNHDSTLTSDVESTALNDRRAEGDRRVKEEDQKSEEETDIASLTRTKESSGPAEGSSPGGDSCRVQAVQESRQNPAEVFQLEVEADVGLESQDELQPNSAADESHTANDENTEAQFVFENEEEREVLSSPLGRRVTPSSERLEDGELRRRREDAESDPSEGDGGDKEASEDEWRLQEDGESSPELRTDIHDDVACADPPSSVPPSPTNPAPLLPPLKSVATGLPRLEVEKEEGEEGEEGEVGEEVRVAAADGGDGQRKERSEQSEEEWGSNVATEEGSTQEEEEEEEEEEEDEFGVFMQAEAPWSEEVNMSASVPCGRSERTALGSCSVAGESSRCTLPSEDRSIHQPDDSWTAFPQDASHAGQDPVGQWWPTGAAEARRDRPPTDHNTAWAFAEAFPSLPGPSDPRGLDAVPTLTQLLRGAASQDQGLLDSFHDLNKMIGQRYKRADGVSRDLLLKTLHLQPPHENRPASWTTTRRLSPGLPSANRHAQTAAAKRRLSYDFNRNITA